MKDYSDLRKGGVVESVASGQGPEVAKNGPRDVTGGRGRRMYGTP